jgi:hypothetical protein
MASTVRSGPKRRSTVIRSRRATEGLFAVAALVLV